MDISLLLNKIIALSSLVSSDEVDSEPASQYARKIDDILKSLRLLIEAFVDSDVASDTKLIEAIEDVDRVLDQIHPLLETWHPLQSKIYFVLHIEPLISKIHVAMLQILKLLETFDELPADLTTSFLELCLKEIKDMELDDTSSYIKQLLENPSFVSDGSDKLAKIVDRLNLKSNQLILIEAVALEKLKEDAEQAEDNGQVEHIDQMIALMAEMHNDFISKKQSESSSPVPIPPDFCCPLSLELMTDPVILASGQTYERAYIKEWIEMGLTVCPKTRQTLARTNLTPNYTVKALIANWCESNKVKLPDPMRSPSSTHSSPLHARAESGVSRNSHILHHTRGNEHTTHDVPKSAASPGPYITFVNGIHREETSARHPRSSSEGSLPIVVQRDGALHNVMKTSLASEDGSINSAQDHSASPGSSGSLLKEEALDVMSDRQTSWLTTVYANLPQDTPGVATSHASSAYNSDNSGEVQAERPPSGIAANLRREHGFSPRFEAKSLSQTIWRRPSDRFVPRMGSTHAVDSRPDMSGIEASIARTIELLLPIAEQ